MLGILRLNAKEANDLAGEIERQGGNADSLRAVIVEVNNPSNGNTSIPAGTIDEEEYLGGKRRQSTIEYGTDLECMVCHDKFDHLLSSTCEGCFREWMLRTKPKCTTK